MKKKLGILFISMASLCLITAGPDKKAEASSQEDRDTLYQVSTLDSLSDGNYDGFVSIADLKEKGDIGLGTFDTLDGEMVVLDGEVYKIKSSGEVEEVNDEDTTPFAAVTTFDKDMTSEITDVNSLADLQAQLDKFITNKDLFYVFRIDGEFEYVKTRSVPQQEKPYPVLSEVTKNQAEFEYENIKGSIVAIWCPEYIGGMNVAGYHFHFLSDDRQMGGHLLDIYIAKATAYADVTDGFSMELSDTEVRVSTTDIEGDLSKIDKNAFINKDQNKVDSEYVKVVNSFLGAINQQDADSAIEMFTEDGSYVINYDDGTQDVLDSIDMIEDLILANIDYNNIFTVKSITSESEDTVIVNGTITGDLAVAKKYEKEIRFTAKVTIRDGKIQKIEYEENIDDLIDFNQCMQGTIGVRMIEEDGSYIITEVMDGFPAIEAGLQVGDMITVVDGMAVSDFKHGFDELIDRVTGLVGTEVTLTIQRGDESFDVVLVRIQREDQ